ncbi:MAG: FumA C-terminus/TtdB family hydratase beta subunit [Spirochaetota bacterium]
MRNISTPLSADTARTLSIGDQVFLSGTIVTARDEAHKFLVKGIQGTLTGKDREIFDRVSKHLKDGVIYHCGPIVSRTNDSYRVVSAGPTTSIREEMYMGDIIRSLGVRVIIGKGGMGENTKKTIADAGAVYVSATGGAAVYLADRIISVTDVFLKETLGEAEAMWVFTVKDFPATVTMDSKGADMHAAIRSASEKKLSSYIV